MPRIAIALALALCVPLGAMATNGTRERCRQKWPNDPAMELHCIQRQVQAAARLDELLTLHDVTDANDLRGLAIAGCMQRWLGSGPNDPAADWEMTVSCSEEQLESLRVVETVRTPGND